MLKDEAHSQKGAEAAIGLGVDNGNEAAKSKPQDEVMDQT